ncbi:MAG: ABC transporter substrate-binding protein [Anaerostipes sp.]|nr:ABC transporter substrate-binding protein [Anaerostipes sp.]
MHFKKFHAVLLSFLFVISAFTGCSHPVKKEKELKKVTLNEVTHSIFYAPQYVALEKGYFKEEGIDLTIETGFGADKSMTAVLSGDADIGFMGPEASIYQYNQGNKDYAVNFAQLTQRAGNFLVSRKPIKNFNWNQLKGKTLIGGRKGGMPQMILEFILKKENMNPKKDVKIIQNIDFANTAGAFTGGTGNFTVEFEPNATLLEKQGKGHVVASLGVDSGYIPYTAYCAKKSYIKAHPSIIQGFTNAIAKGQKYVANHSPKETADIIADQFPDITKNDLIKIIKRYKDQDTYKENPSFSKDGFMLLQDILEGSGELNETVPFSKLVDTTFTKNLK